MYNYLYIYTSFLPTVTTLEKEEKLLSTSATPISTIYLVTGYGGEAKVQRT